jgi:large subunit ribosomal protein L4
MSMQVKLLNCAGQDLGGIDVPESIFSIAPRSDILARVIHWQLAKRRAGTHKVKERPEVSGSTKKIVKQKGSGGARHGSKRGAQFRGGGIIFGPVVRSHAYDLPKKIRAMGLKMALSAKAKSGNLFVFEDFALQEAKTKTALSCFSFLSGSALLIDGDVLTQSMKAAVSNLYQLDIMPQIGANVYDIVRKENVVMTKSALEALGARLS